MIDDIEFLDDATRPRAPKLTGLTTAQREAGEHLKYIHDHLRQNMQVLRRLIDQAAAGEVSAKDVTAQTGELAMVANFRRFGTLCGQYCQFVHGHHSLEDAMVFPALAAQSEALRKVAERLKAEHVVVHEVLLRLIGALEALATIPTRQNFEATTVVYDALERVLLSHLGYEEEEIGDALGYFNVMGDA
jgi:hemerythrin-like domain-containing protein